MHDDYFIIVFINDACLS